MWPILVPDLPPPHIDAMTGVLQWRNPVSFWHSRGGRVPYVHAPKSRESRAQDAHRQSLVLQARHTQYNPGATSAHSQAQAYHARSSRSAGIWGTRACQDSTRHCHICGLCYTHQSHRKSPPSPLGSSARLGVQPPYHTFCLIPHPAHP